MKVVMVLYPGNGHKIEFGELEGQPIPGSADGEIGLREWLESEGHELVTTTDREGGELEENLGDADVLITTPFWPVYVTSEVMDQAPNLKLILTAGVGSDHVDLGEAANRNITVAEQTASNVVSVAEHAVMCVLNLEGKTVGIYGAGSIGQLVAMRLKPFDVKMYYYKRSRLSNTEEAVCGFRYVRLDDMLAHCDIIVVEAPLTPETEGLFDRDVLFSMKKGAWLVNTARGAIVDRDALVEALEEGHLAGYAGDVWDPEPAPPDHPWRTMPHHMMTPHTAGTTLDAQKHYAEDTRRCLEAFFAGEEIEDDHLIVEGGEIVSGTYKAIYEASES